MAKAQKSSTPKTAKAPRTPKTDSGEKLPLPKKYGTQFRKFALKVLEHRFSRAPLEAHADVAGIKEAMTAASAALVAVAEKFEVLPDTFKARKGAAGSSKKLEVGSLVDISEKRRAQYPVEMIDHTGLTVKSISGSKVVVTTAAGGTAFLPRGHLKLAAKVETAPAAA
jgi:hypothetical protein